MFNTKGPDHATTEDTENRAIVHLALDKTPDVATESRVSQSREKRSALSNS